MPFSGQVLEGVDNASNILDVIISENRLNEEMQQTDVPWRQLRGSRGCLGCEFRSKIAFFAKSLTREEDFIWAESPTG